MRAQGGLLGVALLLASTLGACGGGAQSSADGEVATSEPPTTLEPYLGPLTFDWPRDCRVPVVEEASQNGMASTSEFDLQIEDDITGLVVRFDDVRIVEVAGQEVTEELSEWFGEIRLPTIFVGHDGIGTGTGDVSAALEDAMRLDLTVSADQAELVGLNVLVAYWETWVGTWAGLGEVSREREELQAPGESPTGSYTVQLAVESLPVPDDSTASLRAVFAGEGDEFYRAVGDVTAALGASEAAEQLDGASGRVTITMEVLTDPRTLRPTRASYVNHTDATLADGSTETHEESRSWRFDWEAGTCD